MTARSLPWRRGSSAHARRLPRPATSRRRSPPARAVGTRRPLGVHGDASLRHCRLAMVYAASRSAARSRRFLMSRSMISSPLDAVSRQAEEATDRTVAEVTEAGAGWVAGGCVAPARGGSPPDRSDPSANPSTIPATRAAAGTASNHDRGLRRGAGMGMPVSGCPPASGDPEAVGGSGWSASKRFTPPAGRPRRRGGFRPWSHPRTARPCGPACRPAP